MYAHVYLRFEGQCIATTAPLAGGFTMKLIVAIVQDEDSSRLVNSLIRAYAEVKPIMSELEYSAAQQEQYDKKVNFYVALKATIGRASGDFIDLKAYEPGMRYLIDNYIVAEDSKIIGNFDKTKATSLLSVVIRDGL